MKIFDNIIKWKGKEGALLQRMEAHEAGQDKVLVHGVLDVGDMLWLEAAFKGQVEGKTIVVELRLSCNLHDLTIEQVPADAFATQRCLSSPCRQPSPLTDPRLRACR